ncbi:MAG: hypothetical protein AAFR87_02700 [Bacteroidota bacterium]
MKMLIWVSCLLIGFPVFSHAQIEEAYYESGELKSATPLNDKGIFEGTAFTYYKSGAIAKKRQFKDGQQAGLEQEFYPSGQLKAECNYAYGRIHGLRIEYYQNGDMKLKENWYYGNRKGEVSVYYPGQKMRMYGLVDGDDLEFAQRFDEKGMLLTERISAVTVPLEFERIMKPRYFLKKGETLEQGVNLVQVFIPKIPQRYLSFDSPSGRISFSTDPKYSLILRPNPGQKEFILKIRITPEGKKAKTETREIRIPIAFN